MLPVPSATITPGAPPCAPTTVVYASLSIASAASGALARNAFSHARWFTPASPQPSTQCRQSNATPARAQASALAASIERHAASMPSASPDGPALPCASSRPRASASTARVPVPPPSMPIRKMSLPIACFSSVDPSKCH
ncbi:Uncharacterised protein [Burkholderia pseudomallei]|nr:Uncharacterised protein [Burkholderia pseudomallei]